MTLWKRQTSHRTHELVPELGTQEGKKMGPSES